MQTKLYSFQDHKTGADALGAPVSGDNAAFMRIIMIHGGKRIADLEVGEGANVELIGHDAYRLVRVQ